MKAVWFLVVLVVWVSSAQAQPARQGPFVCSADGPAFSGLHLYEENDSLRAGDNRYSQGLRISIAANPDRIPCWLQQMRRWALPGGGGDTFDMTASVFLGHGLYTPTIITTRRLEPNDRGFSDFTYVGAEAHLVGQHARGFVRHTFEVSAGVLNWPAGSFATQAGLHALKLSRIPKGWDTSGGSSFGVYTHYRQEWLFRKVTDSKWVPDVDATIGPALELGNVRVSAGAHGALRVGWNLSGFPSSVIRNGATGDTPAGVELGVITALEGRYVLHSALVKPSPNSDGFTLRRLVHDYRPGVFLRLDRFRASYLLPKRSAEFEVNGATTGSQRFGSISVSYEPGTDHQMFTRWWSHGLKAEIGMGKNFEGPRLTRGSPSGVTGQLAFRKGLKWGLHLGVERIAVAVEGDEIPGEPGDRADVMVRQNLVSLGWGTTLAGLNLDVRAGLPFGTKAIIQTMTHPVVAGRLTEKKNDEDIAVRRGRVVLGAQVLKFLEPHVGLGVDVSYHDLSLSQSAPMLVRPKFLKAVVLVQLRRP